MTGSSDRVRQIQEKIAQRAAQPEEGPEETLDILIFDLAGERYAFPLEEVREVARSGPITPIPGLPSVVLGATGLRGEVLPVLDLCLLLGLQQHPLTPESRLIIVQHEGTTAALLTDRVEDISVLPATALGPPPASGPKGGRIFLQGVTGEGKSTIRLLDLARLLEAVSDGG